VEDNRGKGDSRACTGVQAGIVQRDIHHMNRSTTADVLLYT